MKKISKILSAVLAGAMCFSLAACGTKTVKNPKPTFLNNCYTYTKQNNEGLMQFYSSDPTLDEFLNDYMQRHLRYSDKRIGDIKLGDTKTVWKEWEILSSAWMNTAGIGYRPKDTISNFITNIYQDEFGYIWVDNGTAESDWGQSWEFPNSKHSAGNNHTYFMRYSPYSRVTNNWTSYADNAENGKGGYIASQMSVTDAIKVESKNGKRIMSATFEAVNDPENAAFKEGDYHVYGDKANERGADKTDEETGEVIRGDILNKDLKDQRISEKEGYWLGEEDTVGEMAIAFHAPFLEINYQMMDNVSLGMSDVVDDVEVYWQMNGEETEYKVTYKDFAITKYEKFPTGGRLVFPMYAHEHWGSSETDKITGLKIVFKFRGLGYDGQISLDRVALTYDGRQINNNGVLLAAAAEYYKFTQDNAWLKNNMSKLRRTLQYYLSSCGISGSALITTERLVGHDGSTNGKVGHGIGDGYWDAISNPVVNMYTNMYYFKALKSMEYLERMATANGITADMPSVYKADMSAKETYNETSATLKTKMDAFTAEFQTKFWNETTGRFYLGDSKADDDKVIAYELGDKVDYGFTSYNEAAIELGLATEEQKEAIMQWINGERIVAGDTANNSTKAKQIYQYEFAPRWTTKDNRYQFWYNFVDTYKDNEDETKTGKYAWDKQVQNGGTALHCAYYDMAAEIKTNGSDAAYTKLKNIQKWYEKVKRAGGSGTFFYRMYYDGLYINLQGGNSEGALGLDYEFVEASMLFATVPYQFFGLGSNEANTLEITPNLPSSLTWWKMENLEFGGINYDLTIGENFVQLNSVSANSDYKVKVTLRKPEGDFTVRQHDKLLAEGEDYEVVGDSVVITAPLTNGRIQIITAK